MYLTLDYERPSAFPTLEFIIDPVSVSKHCDVFLWAEFKRQKDFPDSAHIPLISARTEPEDFNFFIVKQLFSDLASISLHTLSHLLWFDQPF